MIFDELKRRILLKAGLEEITPCKCRQLAIEIDSCLNRRISVTTLKRVFGFAKTVHHFSKYTISTLHEFASLPQPVSSALPAAAKIRSFITEEEFCFPRLNDQVCLYPGQLVLEALDLMLKYNCEALPLYKRNKCNGIIYVKDLIYFLTCDDKEYGTLYHKFNFNLQSVVISLHKNKGI